jgi:hypothetical protein
MKKVLLSIGLMMIIAIAGVNIYLAENGKRCHRLSYKDIVALSDCEDSVERQGSMITVKVCNRKTSWWNSIIDISCGTDATASCSFTNVSSDCTNQNLLLCKD